jgi:hypothetical protein
MPEITLTERIAAIAIDAIREIAVATAGTGAGNAIDAAVSEDVTVSARSGTATSEAEPAPAKRGPGRPRKDAAPNGQAGPVETPASEPAVAPVTAVAASNGPDGEEGEDPNALFDDTAAQAGLSPRELRSKVSGMIIRLAKATQGKERIVAMMAEHGAQMPKQLTDEALPAMHASLLRMAAETGIEV